MNTRSISLLLVAIVLTTLPSASVRSQLALPPADPLAALQAIQTTNDDLLKRQEATLKDLSDTTTEAHEMKIYSRRG